MFTLVLAMHAASAVKEQQPSPSLVISAQRADYPADALVAKAEGDVLIALHLEPAGKITCVVRDKAAHAMLRRPSCLLVSQRWPFPPSRNKVGEAQPTDVTLVMRWKLPEPQSNPLLAFDGATPINIDRWMSYNDYPLDAIRRREQGRVEVTFDVTPEGLPANCLVASSSRSRELDKTACRVLLARSLFLPALGPDGGVRIAKARGVFNFRIP